MGVLANWGERGLRRVGWGDRVVVGLGLGLGLGLGRGGGGGGGRRGERRWRRKP